MGLLLNFKKKDKEKEIFWNEFPCKLGRDPSQCKLVISSETVSRQHAKMFQKEEDGKTVYYIKNLSGNGTKVNGIRIENITRLYNLAVVEIGNDTVFTVIIQDEYQLGKTRTDNTGEISSKTVTNVGKLGLDIDKKLLHYKPSQLKLKKFESSKDNAIMTAVYKVLQQSYDNTNMEGILENALQEIRKELTVDFIFIVVEKKLVENDELDKETLKKTSSYGKLFYCEAHYPKTDNDVYLAEDLIQDVFVNKNGYICIQPSNQYTRYENTDVRSVMAVPILCKDDCIGTIICERHGQDSACFSEYECKFLFNIASMLYIFLKQKISQEVERKSLRMVSNYELAKKALNEVSDIFVEINMGLRALNHEKNGAFKMFMDDISNKKYKNLDILAKNAKKEFVNIMRLNNRGFKTVTPIKALLQTADEMAEVEFLTVYDIIKNARLATLSIWNNKAVKEGKKKIIFEANLEENLSVDIIPGDLYKCFMHLFYNSIKAIEIQLNSNIIEQGEIKITAQKNGEYMNFSIEDNGTGMDNFTKKNCTSAGFTTWGQPGSGLASIKNIMKNNGGFINIESEQNEFTKVSLTIPLVNVAPTKSIPKPKFKILLVNDNNFVRKEERTILENLGQTVNDFPGTASISFGHFAEADLLIIDWLSEDGGTKKFAETIKNMYSNVTLVAANSAKNEESIPKDLFSYIVTRKEGKSLDEDELTSILLFAASNKN